MASKLKKYSKKIMCFLSAGMFFIMALFYPLESFNADQGVMGTSKTVEWNSSYFRNDVSFNDTNVFREPTQADIGSLVPGAENQELYTYYFYVAGEQLLFYTEAKYYAYRITVDQQNPVFSGSNIVSSRICIGDYNNIYSASDLLYGHKLDVSGSKSSWYVSNYSQSVSVFLAHMYLLYEYQYVDMAGAYFNSYPSFSHTADYTVTITPFTSDDLLDEIYAELQKIYSNNSQMLTKLGQIYNSLDTVETKLQSLIDVAEDIESNTDELEGLLGTCNSYLASIQDELEEQTFLLEKIYNAIVEFLGLEGDDSVDQMPDDDMNNMMDIENELLGDASVDDLSNDLKVTIDTDSSAFIWDVIDDFVTANSTVFGGFISILSLGVVALILNR